MMKVKNRDLKELARRGDIIDITYMSDKEIQEIKKQERMV